MTLWESRLARSMQQPPLDTPSSSSSPTNKNNNNNNSNTSNINSSKLEQAFLDFAQQVYWSILCELLYEAIRFARVQVPLFLDRLAGRKATPSDALQYQTLLTQHFQGTVILILTCHGRDIEIWMDSFFWPLSWPAPYNTFHPPYPQLTKSNYPIINSLLVTSNHLLLAGAGRRATLMALAPHGLTERRFDRLMHLYGQRYPSVVALKTQVASDRTISLVIDLTISLVLWLCYIHPIYLPTFWLIWSIQTHVLLSIDHIISILPTCLPSVSCILCLLTNLSLSLSY